MSNSSSAVNFLVSEVRRNGTKIYNWCVAVLFWTTGSSHAY
jgi:hypothetical protein